jgi:hypothetical protein
MQELFFLAGDRSHSQLHLSVGSVAYCHVCHQLPVGRSHISHSWGLVDLRRALGRVGATRKRASRTGSDHKSQFISTSKQPSICWAVVNNQVICLFEFNRADFSVVGYLWRVVVLLRARLIAGLSSFVFLPRPRDSFRASGCLLDTTGQTDRPTPPF